MSLLINGDSIFFFNPDTGESKTILESESPFLYRSLADKDEECIRKILSYHPYVLTYYEINQKWPRQGYCIDDNANSYSFCTKQFFEAGKGDQYNLDIDKYEPDVLYVIDKNSRHVASFIVPSKTLLTITKDKIYYVTEDFAHAS